MFYALFVLVLVFIALTSFLETPPEKKKDHLVEAPSDIPQESTPPPRKMGVSFPSNPVIRMQLKKKGVNCAGIFDEDVLREMWLEHVRDDQCEFRDRTKYT